MLIQPGGRGGKLEPLANQPNLSSWPCPISTVAGCARSGARQIGAAALAFVVVIGAVVVAVSLLGGSKHTPSFATQASELVSPVVADNGKIASAVQALTPGANSQEAQTTIATAQDATEVAQQSLALLKPSRSQAALRPRSMPPSAAKPRGSRRHPVSSTARQARCYHSCPGSASTPEPGCNRWKRRSP